MNIEVGGGLLSLVSDRGEVVIVNLFDYSQGSLLLVSRPTLITKSIYLTFLFWMAL